MKILKTLIAILMLLIGVNLFAKTAADRSTIVIDFKNFGWKGVNAGWEEDECLISPNHTLDYLVGKTNRNQYPANPHQWIVPPEYETNWGEQVSNKYTSNDNVCPLSASDGANAELSEMWISWDTNWIYVAVKGDLQHKYQTGGGDSGNNLMILFDRIRDFGIIDFPTGTPKAVWDKAVFVRDFEADMYIGAWGGYQNISPKAIGGVQFRGLTNLTSPADVSITEINFEGSATTGLSNTFYAFYNGVYEFNTRERVFLTKIKIETFTNWMPSVSSITLKIMALTVDGSTGAGARTYDFMPNNLAGVNADRKTVGDNYFLIPFTDSEGMVLTNVSPKYDARIQYLPGSRSFNPPTVSNFAVASNTSTAVAKDRKLFAPSKNEVTRIGVVIPKNQNLFQGSIKIYTLRGEMVRNLTSDKVWQGNSLNDTTYAYNWNGRNDAGSDLPMGTYIVVFTAISEDGLAWNNKFYVTLVR